MRELTAGRAAGPSRRALHSKLFANDEPASTRS